MNVEPDPLVEALQQGEGEPTPPSPEATPPQEPPPGPAYFDIRGQHVSEEDLASLLEFQQWAEQNPSHMQAFAQYLRGEAQFVVPEAEPQSAPGGTPAPPPAPQIDWEGVDPTIRSIYDAQHSELEALQQRVQQFEEPLQQMQQAQYEAARAEAESALDLATGRIRDRFKLNEDEMEELANDAAQLQIVPTLRQQGMAPQAAIETALETAFWRSEKWRSRAVDEELASRSANGRKANASKVAGSSAATGDGLGSQQPVPANEEERRAAMAAEIAEALRGTP